MEPTNTLIEIGKAAVKYGPAVVEALTWLWGALLRWLDGTADEAQVRVADVLPVPLLSRLEMVRGRAAAEAIVAEELAVAEAGMSGAEFVRRAEALVRGRTNTGKILESLEDEDLAVRPGVALAESLHRVLMAHGQTLTHAERLAMAEIIDRLEHDGELVE